MFDSGITLGLGTSLSGLGLGLGEELGDLELLELLELDLARCFRSS